MCRRQYAIHVVEENETHYIEVNTGFECLEGAMELLVHASSATRKAEWVARWKGYPSTHYFRSPTCSLEYVAEKVSIAGKGELLRERGSSCASSRRAKQNGTRSEGSEQYQHDIGQMQMMSLTRVLKLKIVV